jgi:polysaccharide deacetylase family protein (PEP-CTERM system associated)
MRATHRKHYIETDIETITTHGMKNKKKILLTIDVEDWFQVENLRPWFPPSSWNGVKLRVERNIHKILDIFDEQSGRYAKGTFFTLGWIAERLPHIVREIDQRGHEVASHGYGHVMCSEMTETELRQDLIRSKKLLEDIISKEVIGYRAPNFSISYSVLKIIQNTGYQYDSSFNSFSRHGRYGKLSLNGSRMDGIAFTLNDGLKELPISNLNIGGQILPWGGGGYFRFFPFFLFKIGVQYILNKSDAYMFYLHPWEIDPEQPKISNTKGSAGWRHYINLKKTSNRLKKLIYSFRNCEYLTCRQYLQK